MRNQDPSAVNLGRYYGSDAESVAMREELLRPALFQHEQLRRSLRRGRSAGPAEDEGDASENSDELVA